MVNFGTYPSLSLPPSFFLSLPPSFFLSPFPPLPLSSSYTLKELDLSSFWNWSHFSDYAEFLAAFTAFFSLLTFLLFNVSWYCELLGLASTLTEACLAIPQWLKNNQNKSTAGMR